MDYGFRIYEVFIRIENVGYKYCYEILFWGILERGLGVWIMRVNIEMGGLWGGERIYVVVAWVFFPYVGGGVYFSGVKILERYCNGNFVVYVRPD